VAKIDTTVAPSLHPFPLNKMVAPPMFHGETWSAVVELPLNRSTICNAYGRTLHHRKKPCTRNLLHKISIGHGDSFPMVLPRYFPVLPEPYRDAAQAPNLRSNTGELI
jgi:hypothetical protein